MIDRGVLPERAARRAARGAAAREPVLPRAKRQPGVPAAGPRGGA